jgi:hypothetical protein
MAFPLDALLDSVKSAVTDHANDQKHIGLDPSGVLGKISGLFGAHQSSDGNNVRPASEDPCGDPADQAGGGGKVKLASQNPYGDPADGRR